jgi:hypothetical protein
MRKNQKIVTVVHSDRDLTHFSIEVLYYVFYLYFSTNNIQREREREREREEECGPTTSDSLDRLPDLLRESASNVLLHWLGL